MTSQNTPAHGEALRAALRRRGVAYWDRVEPDSSHREAVEAGGLLITGSVGTGKTWLAAAIAADWFSSHSFEAGGYLHSRPSMRFATSPAMLRAIRDSYGSPSTEREAIKEWTSHGLLIIDDLGKEQATPWAAARLWEIVDEIVREPDRSLIVTTQFAPNELAKRMAAADGAETARAIVSRLATLKPVRLEGSDRRMERWV